MTNIQHVKQQDSGYRVTWDNGTVSSVPPGHRFQADIQEWIAADNTPEPIETFAERKKRLRAYINAKRSAVEQGGFVFSGRRFNSDAVSVARITGLMATISAGNTVPPRIRWTDADDVERKINASNFADFHAALVAHAMATHQVNRALKTAVAAGRITSEAEIDAANWPPNR